MKTPFIFTTGQCQCQGNFSGDDCALDLGNPPVVFPTDKACDRLEDSCLNVTVFGSGFVSSTDLVCFVQELMVSNFNFPDNILNVLGADCLRYLKGETIM